MQKLNFYTKLNCGLCDQAQLLLMEIAYDIPLEIDIIDITHTSNKLETDYRERIPVIALEGAITELAWPFTREDIKSYLAR